MHVPHCSYFWHHHNNNQLTRTGISLLGAEKATSWYQRGAGREDKLPNTDWDVLTSLGQPAWRWREQGRWRSQRKSQQPFPCSCWGSAALQSAAQDATKGEEGFIGVVLIKKGITSNANIMGTDERSSPPLRTSAVALWSKHTAKFSPCRSSRSQSRAPSGSEPTTSPCVPNHQRLS